MQKILISFLLFFQTGFCVGKNYILMDMDSHRIIEGNNVNKRFLTASIAKILTAYVTIMEVDLKDDITICHDTTLQEGSSLYLIEGETVKVETLLYGLMLRSGNDAAYALANYVGGSVEGFVFLMNEYAKVIGMRNSTFENPSGLDSTTKNYSTPYDMALLMSTCFQNETFRRITQTVSYQDDGYHFVNKHRLVRKGKPFTGGKTGYTKQAGRTLVTTASHNDLNFVVVTFRDSNDFETHERLLNKGLSLYQKKKIVGKQTFKGNDALPYLDKDIYMAVLKREKDIALEIVLYNNKMRFRGDLVIYIDGKEALTYPLKGYSVLGMIVDD